MRLRHRSSRRPKASTFPQQADEPVPAARKHVRTKQRPDSSKCVTRTNDPARCQTVLIVDDDPNVLIVLKAALTHAGYGVLTADGGDDALEVLTSNEHLVAVISDYAMVGLNGAALLTHVRELRPSLPCLLTTGMLAVEDSHRLPVDVEVMRKPFRLDIFAEKVRSICGSENQRRSTRHRDDTDQPSA